MNLLEMLPRAAYHDEAHVGDFQGAVGRQMDAAEAARDDLMKQADNKEMLPEKEIFSNVLTGSHIVCYYDDFSEEIGQVRASGIPYTNIRKMI